MATPIDRRVARKDTTFGFRVGFDDLKRFKTAARNLGIPVSRLVRDAAVEHAERVCAVATKIVNSRTL